MLSRVITNKHKSRKFIYLKSSIYTHHTKCKNENVIANAVININVISSKYTQQVHKKSCTFKREYD